MVKDNQLHTVSLRSLIPVLNGNHRKAPLFVFLPKLIQRGMQADADAVVEAFGKNEQVMMALTRWVVRLPSY